jgi:hypothetical protein
MLPDFARLRIMKLLLAILIAAACGAGIGLGTANLKYRQHPWIGRIGTPPMASGGRAEIDADEFDFGRLQTTENGSHEFTVTNRGDRSLALNLGHSSCSCTVSELKEGNLEPGKSTTVRVTWRSKSHAGPFHQSVTILTSDPTRPEILFKIKGEYFRTVYVEPDELTFSHISGSEPVTHEARIFSNVPDQPLKIDGIEFKETSDARFFGVDSVPLGVNDLPKNNGIKSGTLVRVTVKPGLPLGTFQQTIRLKTNHMDQAVELHLIGSVGEVTLVGHGWSSETGVLEIGTLDGRSATQRLLVVQVRGSNAKNMRFKVARVEPDFLKASVGEPKVDESGLLSQTKLAIEIPEGKALGKKVPANYMGDNHGKLGEILLETTGSQPLSLLIHVRFAISGGN